MVRRSQIVVISSATGLCIAAVCCILGLFVLAIVYPISVDKQQNYLAGRCVVVDRRITTQTCSHACNCHQQCSGSTSSRSCHQVCSSCPYTCYDAYVTYRLNVTTGEYTTTKQIFSKEVPLVHVFDGLDRCCRVGSVTACYYDQRDPNKIQFKKEQPNLSIVFSIVFFVCSLLAIVVCVTVNLVVLVSSFARSTYSYSTHEPTEHREPDEPIDLDNQPVAEQPYREPPAYESTQ